MKTVTSIAISEKQFENQIKDLAKIFGWRYYHTWRSIHSPAGFPDIVMVRPPRLLFAELKAQDGKLSPEQESWLDDLKECIKVITVAPISKAQPLTYYDAEHSGTLIIPEVYLFRPSDFEKIAKVLA